MQLDAAVSEARKQAGMQLALDLANDWSERILEEFAAWLAKERERGIRRVTIEKFRAEAKNHPLSHKAWGSLPRLAMRAGLIRRALDDSGEPIYRRAAAPKTHAHPVAVYVITGGKA